MKETEASQAVTAEGNSETAPCSPLESADQEMVPDESIGRQLADGQISKIVAEGAPQPFRFRTLLIFPHCVSCCVILCMDLKKSVCFEDIPHRSFILPN